MERIVFCRFGAVVGSVLGDWIGFWQDLGVKDPNQLTFVDFSKTTNLAQNPAQLLIAQVDAGEEESPTSLSPLSNGPLAGAIYINKEFLKQTHLTMPPKKFENEAREYEFQMLYVRDGLATRRYYGFHARINSNPPGIDVFPAGQSKLAPAPNVTTIPNDLDTIPAGGVPKFEAIGGGLTQIGNGQNDLKEGALFIESSVVKQFKLQMVKLPRSEGIGP